jgi:hypothetical protein
MDMNATDVMAAQARMESARSPFDALWGEIATLVFPRQSGNFGGGLDSAGFNRQQTNEAVMHDPYSAQALEDGVAAFEGFVMPRGQRWQGLSLSDERLMKLVPVRQWLEAVEIRLFALRNDPMSGFSAAIHESGMSLFAFGVQSTWPAIRRDPASGMVAGLSYQSEYVNDIWIECDAAGYPIRVHRRLRMTAEAALREWGDKLPPKVAKAAKSDKPADNAQEFTFLHVIEPNPAMDRARVDAVGMPWRGGYLSVEDKMVFATGGYDTMPRIVSRFSRSPNATYGHSPTMLALPLIRVLQAMTMDRTHAAEMNMKPSLLAQDDEVDGPLLSLQPYGVTYGGLDDRGNPLFKPFLDGADATDARELAGEMRAAIDRVYYRDLLQINREMKTHISAARTMEEIAEKGLLLSPLARQENEWLSRMTMRELQLMDEIGLLDDMPPEVAEYFEAQGGIDIRYDNALSHMQEAGKSVAYLNLAQQVGLLAQFDASVVEDFKREYPLPKVLTELGRIAGVPASMMATEAEKSAFDDAKQQAAQQQQLLAAVPALAAAGKDLQGQGDML